jgi:hypothetical protein
MTEHVGRVLDFDTMAMAMAKDDTNARSSV